MLIPFMAAGVVCVAQAITPEDACTQLLSTLENQVAVLQGIKDKETAAAAVAPLKDIMTRQGELFSVDENALWLHIDNSVEIKQEFLLTLQSMAAEFSRLEAAKYFNCAELRQLVYARLLTGGAAAKG